MLEVKASVGKRERGAGNRGDEQPQPSGSFTSGMRTKIARATAVQALVLHDGLEAGHLEAFPGVLDGFLIGVGADQHVVILVALRATAQTSGNFSFAMYSRASSRPILL